MFHELLNAEKFVDVTLACESNSLKCHKVRIITSMCSLPMAMNLTIEL